MEAVVVLLLVSLLIALGFLGAFFWAVRTDQFRDTVSPAMRMLFDDNYDDRRTNTGSSGVENRDDDQTIN